MILLGFLPFLVCGQVKNIGIPRIVNYPKSEYSGGTQNWGIAQDSLGFMYFANNDGVLRFDGNTWELIEVPLSLVRSVYVDSNNRIFVALLYNFGQLVPAENGKYYFESFLERVPETDRDFNDVWKIHEIDGKIIFQAFEKMFIYNGNDIGVIRPQEKFHFSFVINGRLIFQEPGIGFFEWKDDEARELKGLAPLKDSPVLSVLELAENEWLIGTSDNGLFLYKNGRLTEWNTAVNRYVKSNKLYSAVKVMGNNLAFGTILSGLVISDTRGNILQRIDRGKELQNNTVLSLFSDYVGNLWLGLDNGISYIELNTPLTYISAQGEIGTGYCAIVFGGMLYLGTNQGLYRTPFTGFDNLDTKFELIKNTEGQVWSLKVFDNQLICGHNLGTFVVKGNTAQKISDRPGAWDFIKIAGRPNLMIGGHYEGMVLFENGPNGWRFKHKIKGFDESSRVIKQDPEGFLWMSHGGKGIYKIVLNERLDSVSGFRLYGKKDGLPSDFQNILFELNDRLYISTIEGAYRFNPQSGRFEEAGEVNELFGVKERLMYVKPDSDGNIWYITDSQSGVLRRNEDLTYTRINDPFWAINDSYVSEFEFIYPFDNEHTFIGIDKGFAHYTSKFPKSYDKEYKTFITRVELNYLDTVLYPQNISGAAYRFPFKKNTIRFHFSAPFFEGLENLKFSCYLENYSETWTEWSPDIYKEYNNLKYGEYRFVVKALNNYGIESGTSEFRFTILPPWYRTPLAHATYALLVMLVLFMVVMIVRHRMLKSHEKARIKHEEELRKRDEMLEHQAVVAEKEIIRLRNEKLRADMLYRDKELANQTNNLVQKNRFLQKIKQELQHIQSTTEDGAVKSKMAILKKRIEKEIDDKQQNRIFESYFEEVHKEFFERLKERYPQLSPKDLRLCAYIRMNIPTKEIATLLNISYRGVEISRYRLRKKMDLSRDVNLSTFLSGI